MGDHLDAFAASLGMSLLGTDPVVVAMPVSERHHNFYDTTHGGAVFAVAAAALAAATDPEATILDGYLTLSAATTAGDTLTAAVEEVTAGRTLATHRVQVVRNDGKVVATLTATVLRPGQVRSSSPR